MAYELHQTAVIEWRRTFSEVAENFQVDVASFVSTTVALPASSARASSAPLVLRDIFVLSERRDAGGMNLIDLFRAVLVAIVVANDDFRLAQIKEKKATS